MPDAPRRRLRAPQEDGAALIDPPLSEVTRLIQYNRQVLADFDRVIGIPGFRNAARADLLELSVIYESDKTVAGDPDRPFILTGHQPELFHPGVWFKNYLIAAIAKTIGGIAVNLTIDNDELRSPSIRVPTGISEFPRVEEVAYDNPQTNIPWEEVAVSDRNLIHSFPERVITSLASLDIRIADQILLRKFWPHVEQSIEDRTKNLLALYEESCRFLTPPPGYAAEQLQSLVKLGECFTQARHELERDIGLATKETDLSVVCGTAAFVDFLSVLLERHREFHDIYNVALHDYRQENHIRGRSRPVPDLTRDDEWFEMPFWIWSSDNPRRRRAFVRRIGKDWELSDREGVQLRRSDCSQIRGLPWILVGTTLVILRPRALITTMYARLVLSDLFIHGIGGAKYDEVTDEIIRRFFGIEPPKFITATATFRLPIDRPHVTADDLRASARLLRDVRYRPEALLSHPLVKSDAAIGQQLEAIAAEKREYLARHNPRRNAADVFAGLDRINLAAHTLLRPVEEELKAAHARLIDDARKSALLGSREFSFVLFSEELPARLLALCQGVA